MSIFSVPSPCRLAVLVLQRAVCIYVRAGTMYDELQLPMPDTPLLPSEENLSSCLALEWDAQGDKLAVLPRGSVAIWLCAVASKEWVKLDTGLKELAFMTWSKTSSVLAVGTAKGNLLLFNDKLGKKVPIMGKHTKRITCGAWSASNKLALGSEDRHITVNKENGDTVREIPLRLEPTEVTFADMKDDDKKGGKQENTLSVVVGYKTLYLLKVTDKDDAASPLELSFQEQYGQIRVHRWFGDGYIVLGFSSGMVVVVSTHNKEMSEEVHCSKMHTDAVSDIAYCQALDRAASCSGNVIKVIDMVGCDLREIKADTVELDPTVHCERLQWTPDGQVLTVSTAEGHVHNFLASLPLVHAAIDGRVAYLTSLLELSVVDTTAQEHPLRIALATEPAFCSLGPTHVAVGMNNQAWFHRASPGPDAGQVDSQREYLGTIQDLRLNSCYASVLSDGRIEIHVITTADGYGGLPNGHAAYPDAGDGAGAADITCQGLTESFLIYGTRRGSIKYLFLDPEREPVAVNEYRHADGGIRKVFPNAAGTRLVFADDRHVPYLYNPVNDQLLTVPDAPQGSLEMVLWDVSDPNVFVLVDGREIKCYIHWPASVAGAAISVVGITPRPPTFVPLALNGGVVTCQIKSGGLEKFTLQTHSRLQGKLRQGRDELLLRFEQNLALLHFREAFDAAVTLRDDKVWERLTSKALHHLEVEVAARAFRQRGDAGMVLSLQRLIDAGVEERSLLAGHVLLLTGQDYNAAQELFLRSSRPLEALEMRKDLKQWDQALKLARQLHPDAIPELSLQYAIQLEMRGEYQAALGSFEQTLRAEISNENQRITAQGGMARVTLQLGDIRRGKQMAVASDSPQLCRDCAAILEGINQLQDAAELYERGGMHEKAAGIYIATKNFAAAQPLMTKITTPKLHIQFAKAKEVEGKFDAAAEAYEAAGDMDNVVRLLLAPLRNVLKAFALVRRTRSSEGAAMVAKHCQDTGDYRGAVEFLILAKRAGEAFEVAQLHDEMDAYTHFVGDAASKEEYLKLARYFETKSAFSKAADLYQRCGMPPQALKLYLRSATPEDIDKAIELVGHHNVEALTRQLEDYLMSDNEKIAKNHTYLFRLQMALGNYEQAAKTAVIIARQEQEMGNYKVAHSQLLETYRELQAQNRHVPSELARQLMLLHSYILVKTLIKLGDHTSSARMLVRVARNISRFPAHVVPILTSTVIECQRAGLKKTAFEYASMLMRPEYRVSIAVAYKKKIEDIVRKRDRGIEEEEEAATPCPFCSLPVPETQLECPSCKNTLPYCVASGRHMVLQDWATCPGCQFPAIGSEMCKVVEAEKACPMCGRTVSVEDLGKPEDPKALLKKYTDEPPPASRRTSIGGSTPLPVDTNLP